MSGRRNIIARALVLGTLLVAATTNFAGAAEQDFSTWLKGLRSEAAEKGIRAQTLDRALSGLQPIPRVIELDRKQPEFTLTFDQYISRVVPQSRVDTGKARLRENRELLDEISKKYGVQPRFIVAFWGIESDFGRLDGGFSVVQSLATLAFDGRRSAFFRAELIRALRIIDQGHTTADSMRGSWAGAMGHFQFMPSTFESFAVDYDGDGKRDIWSNKKDAFASAANYLSRSGWKGDQTWGRQVKLPTGFDKSLIGLDTKKSLEEWSKLGITRSDGGPLPTARSDVSGSVVVADNKNGAGPAFLIYDNYRVTLKWNRSTFFAVAVGTLAERIGDG
jgi:membrane-bound lytic murein transglycosylase B